MQKATVMLSLLIACAAFGQQKNEFSIFASNPGTSLSDSVDTSTGFGLAYTRQLTPRFSTQIALTSEHHESLFEPFSFNTEPIDLTARYDFVNDTRWKPYLGAGLRYVAAPDADPAFGYSNHLGAELAGGTTFRITPSFGFMLDGKFNLGSHDEYDAPFKASFGLLWRR